MKQVDVQVGQVYAVKVSGNVVPVRVERERETRARYVYASGPHRRETHGGYDAVNLRTGKRIHVSAARLRHRLVERDGKWVPAAFAQPLDASIKLSTGGGFKGGTPFEEQSNYVIGGG